jgi:hypothetical protein
LPAANAEPENAQTIPTAIIIDTIAFIGVLPFGDLLSKNALAFLFVRQCAALFGRSSGFAMAGKRQLNSRAGSSGRPWQRFNNDRGFLWA